MNKIIIGIDPGFSGAIAIYNPKHIKNTVDVFKMPETPVDMLNFFKYNTYGMNEVIVYLEAVHGLPGMAGGAMFAFGKNFGHLQAVLAALRIKTIEVSPQRWTKTMNIGTKTTSKDKHDWKKKLKMKAQQLYPYIDVTLWNADALLILDYALKQENVYTTTQQRDLI